MRQPKLDYYDVERFLAEQEHVPGTHTCGSVALGREFGGSRDCIDLPEDSKISLPFWLASALDKQEMLEIEIYDMIAEAGVFHDSVWSKIKAEPRLVNLAGDYSDSFFELARLVGDFFEGTFDEEYKQKGEELKEKAREAFEQRFKKMLLHAALSASAFSQHATTYSSESAFDEDYLTRSERRLYKLGKDSANDFVTWKYSTKEKMVASKVITEVRKRKAMSNSLGRMTGDGQKRDPLRARNF